MMAGIRNMQHKYLSLFFLWFTFLFNDQIRQQERETSVIMQSESDLVPLVADGKSQHIKLDI